MAIFAARIFSDVSRVGLALKRTEAYGCPLMSSAGVLLPPARGCAHLLEPRYLKIFLLSTPDNHRSPPKA
jgi:hypothetical protein